MIFEKHGNLKYKFGNRHPGATGYYVSTVVLNEAIIQTYIREQEKQDILEDKLTAKEYDNPFQGSRSSVRHGLNASESQRRKGAGFSMPC